MAWILLMHLMPGPGPGCMCHARSAGSLSCETVNLVRSSSAKPFTISSSPPLGRSPPPESSPGVVADGVTVRCVAVRKHVEHDELACSQ